MPSPTNIQKMGPHLPNLKYHCFGPTEICYFSADFRQPKIMKIEIFAGSGVYILPSTWIVFLFRYLTTISLLSKPGYLNKHSYAIEIIRR